MTWSTGEGSDERKRFPGFISGTLRQIIFYEPKKFPSTSCHRHWWYHCCSLFIIRAKTTPSKMPAKADPLPAEKVKEFVSAGHNNLEKVKSLLLELPTLLYATWDLGGGDFETALEGAGHVGNKDIANHLIKSGARAICLC